jgi:hypothetical protein
MLRTDLVELVNSGEAWAFIGSGASAEAGLPGWADLVAQVISRLAPDVKPLVTGDRRFTAAHSKDDFPSCLGVVDRVVGREQLDKLVAEILTAQHVAPGRVLSTLADWPFAGYVTTNYDSLIQQALRPLVTGWPTVGNSENEVRKVSGGARDVIWQVHGSVGLPADEGRLVLTDRDYDDLYLMESPLLAQLRAFLQHHRVVFFGFSFRDPELARLLKITTRYCNPAKPAYAFIQEGEGDRDRRAMLQDYNVDVIPYQVTAHPHAALPALLGTYGSFIIRRSLQFGQRGRRVPSYDPETTGLMVFNELVLRGRAKVGPDVPETLLRARVLALLRYEGPKKSPALIQDLEEKARLFMDEPAAELSEKAAAAVGACLRALIGDGLVQADHDGDERSLSLSPAGRELVEAQSAKAELAARRFTTSLTDRARLLLSDNEAGAKRVAEAAGAFLKECVRRRALGVAMTLAATRPNVHDFQMVALLQTLPEFMGQLQDEPEATALVRVIQEVLAKRDQPENAYLGLAMQSQFGVHLLGLDPDALRARMADLAATFFLIDSSTLIHFMARSSSGNEPAKLLISRLHDLGAPAVTTDLLAIEVAEHARWAGKQVAPDGSLNARTAIALTGRAGGRANQFLTGFVTEAAEGRANDYRAYLESIIGPGGGAATDPVFARAIEHDGIPCMELAEFQGFEECSQEILSEVAALQNEIEERRRSSETYRHERQVKAEAEAFVVVRSMRQGRLRSGQTALRGAFFVSPMRNVEDLTMRPDALLQWLNTLVPADDAQLAALFDGLVAEMTDRDMSIVDLDKLALAFLPLAHGSKERLVEETTSEQALIGRRWGTGAVKDLAEVQGLDAVVTAEIYFRQKAKQLEQDLADERRLSEAREQAKKLDQGERDLLERLKAEKRQRELRNRHKKRSATNPRKPGRRAT